MENKLTNEEIAKVFVMYPNADVINPKHPDTIISYKNMMSAWFESSKYDISQDDYCNNRKLLLFHGEKITVEHAIEVAITAGFLPTSWSSIQLNTIGQDITIGITRNKQYRNLDPLDIINAAEKLRELEYMVPYKGQSLFELGIAIEKTEQ